jgi:hypothetical protein
VLSRGDSLVLPEGVLLQGSLEAALKLLAGPEYKASVEKVRPGKDKTLEMSFNTF